MSGGGSLRDLLARERRSKAATRPAGEFRCPCGKRGEHRHRPGFTGTREGALTMGGQRYEIHRTGSRAPTWVAVDRGTRR